jgi:hypothetical protein
MGRVLAAAIMVALAPGCVTAASKTKRDRLTEENRHAIFRALAWEYATARQPLPAAKEIKEALHVIAAEPASPADGPTAKINDEKLRADLAALGAVIHTGDLVQITRLEFKQNTLLLEINGGGKKKKKWYERIRVEAGPQGGPVGGGASTDRPPSDRPRYAPGSGSWVLLVFPGEFPDVTPDQVKALLAGALDFSRRSANVPWVETLPPEYQEAIKQKRAVVGMNREMVLAALGRPERKIRETKDGQEVEDWIFGQPPFVTFVRFIGEEVVDVKEYR